MKPPSHYDPLEVSTEKSTSPSGGKLRNYDGPTCFAIPGKELENIGIYIIWQIFTHTLI